MKADVNCGGGEFGQSPSPLFLVASSRNANNRESGQGGHERNRGEQGSLRNHRVSVYGSKQSIGPTHPRDPPGRGAISTPVDDASARACASPGRARPELEALQYPKHLAAGAARRSFPYHCGHVEDAPISAEDCPETRDSDAIQACPREDLAGCWAVRLHRSDLFEQFKRSWPVRSTINACAGLKSDMDKRICSAKLDLG